MLIAGYSDEVVSVIGRTIIVIGVSALLLGNVYLLGHEVKRIKQKKIRY
ncbi:hypothetical protein ACVLD2_001246 [Paenibacillus sp. PvR052]